MRRHRWRIPARRLKVKSGEIDLVARKGRVLAAIEVKARDTCSAASAAISAHRRRRIARAFDHFLALRPERQRLDARFDVMLVAPGRPPRQVVDAWREAF